MMKNIFYSILIITLCICLCGCSVSFDSMTLPYSPAVTEDVPTIPYIPILTQPIETEPAITEPPTEPTEPEPTRTEPLAEPSDQDFVRVTDYIPDMVTELRYATSNNFTGQVIYEFQEPWLRYGTVKKLMGVQAELVQAGYKLKIWDAFRPAAAQFKLWEVCPDSTYVANPYNGFSSHSRGNTLDITMVYADGTEVEMPTGFDDFSTLADRNFSDCTPEVAKNAAYLEEIMEQNGFSGYYGEWWHYTDTDSYPVEQNFNPAEME